MSTTNLPPEKKSKDQTSTDTSMIFNEFDKAMAAKLAKDNSTQVKKAVERGFTKAQREVIKSLASGITGEVTPKLSEQVDKIPNPKVQEILTIHKQTQDFHNKELETQKNEAEVVSKELANEEKVRNFEFNDIKKEQANIDLGIKQEEQLAAEGHAPGISSTGIAPPALEDFVNSAVSLGIVDRNGTPTELIGRAADLQAKLSLGMFTDKTDQANALKAIESLKIEAAVRSGLPADAVAQRIAAATAEFAPGINQRSPLRHGLFNRVDKEATRARLFAANQAIGQVSKSTASAADISLKAASLRSRLSKVDPEDPNMQEAQQFGERLAIERFSDTGPGGAGSILMTGVSDDGKLKLADAGDIGYLSEAYQTLLTAKASAQSQGLDAKAKEFDMALDRHVDKVIDEWIEASNFSDEGIKIDLQRVSDKLKKAVSGPEGLVQKSKSTSKLGIAQASGVIFQVEMAKDYLRRINQRLPQKLLERKQRRRAEEARKATENKQAEKKFGSGAGVGAGPGNVPLFAPINFKKIFGG